MDECELCGDTDFDHHKCVQCGRVICTECCEWCHDEDDEPSGEWFCTECIEAAIVDDLTNDR